MSDPVYVLKFYLINERSVENIRKCEISQRLIFEGNKFRTPRQCILVEGNPGYGKTTLAQKIALDWANKEIIYRVMKLISSRGMNKWMFVSRFL